MAASQHGLVTREQVIAAGGTGRSIELMLSSGRWDEHRKGVYLVGVAAGSRWPQQAMGAVLAAGGDAYAGFRTAARLHGFVEGTGRLELLTDGYRRVRLPGVLTHRTIHLLPEDVTVVAGIPTTSPNRTLIDLGARQPEAALGRWIDQGILRNQIDVASLARRTSELNIRGRPKPIPLMRALSLRADGHDPGRSALEARVIAAAKARGLPELVRQHPVRRPDGRMAFIDLARPQAMLAIELDGWASHGVRSAFEPDRIRANELLLLGWHLLRFTWHMRDDYICDTIDTAVDQYEPR
jgi:very-short-patch-repair endonuclease